MCMQPPQFLLGSLLDLISLKRETEYAVKDDELAVLFVVLRASFRFSFYAFAMFRMLRSFLFLGTTPLCLWLIYLYLEHLQK
jgi:hypothetical protein